MIQYNSSNNLETHLLKHSADADLKVVAFEELSRKFDQINSLVVSGKEIPKELTKNFVTFPLSDDPFQGDW